MLINFTIENFRSIKAPQTLSLLATSSTEHPENCFTLTKEKKIRLLKSAVIYGANASGKSNVIKALQNALQFIINSTDLKLDQAIPYYEPFKFCPESQQEPTRFSLEFLVGETRYTYSVSFNEKKIISEELLFFPKKIKTKLFTRKNGRPIDFGAALTGPKKSIEEQLLDNVLFFSKAANSNNFIVQAAYRSLSERFFIDFDSCTNPDTFLEKVTSMVVNKGDRFASMIKKFINKIDNSITDIQIKKIDTDKVKIKFHENAPEETKKIILDAFSCEVKTTHTNNLSRSQQIQLNLKEESSGTIKSFNLAGPIIISLMAGATLAIDELNNSLHPVITRFIIELFNNPKSNPNNAQLIFTTHDTNLLDPSLFRRDQIWFTEKNDRMETHLFSLSEFDCKEVRNNTPFEKWYLSGKFGAIPIVNDFDMSLEEAVNAKSKE